MGWDAWAEPLKRATIANSGSRIVDGTAREAFSAAAEQVTQKVGGCDGLLPDGGLDLRGSGRMLELATARSVYEKHWSPEDVQHLAGRANWGEIDAAYDDLDPDDSLPGRLRRMGEQEFDEAFHPVEYWSARVFLETCARLNLGIKFTF